MQKKSLDLWVGLFVLLGALALFFLAIKAGNLGSINFGAVYPVQAKFDNIGGLKPQAPVKSAGVVVGRVGAINFDDKTFQAVVTLNLDATLSVSEGFVGQNPDFRLVGRAIYRHDAGRRYA